MFGLAFENFPCQIIEHKAVTAGKSLDKTGGVGASLHGEGGQLQPGDPAFGAGFERGNVCISQFQPHHPVEKLGGLGGGEAQVGERAIRSVGRGRAGEPRGSGGSSRVAMTRCI